MKIAVIGTGMMGRITIRDLYESPGLEKIVVADVNEEAAKKCAASFNDPRINGFQVDAHDITQTANLIKGCDAVINASQYHTNLSVMQACLKAGCHYSDLGGMFHTTVKQLKLFDDFQKAGLTAVIGIGSAPGITNICAAYGCDRLDEVEAIKVYCVTANATDMKGIDVFRPPYSLITVMEEFSEPTMQFVDGEYRTFPALSGAEEVIFPDPIGKQTCYHTLHSEPATLPMYYKDKGLKVVLWRLGFPPDVTEKVKMLANIGFANKEPVKVKGVELTPVDVLDPVVVRQMKERLKGVKLDYKLTVGLRGHAIGKRNGRKFEYIVDCLAGVHSRWKTFCGTSVPPSIVAQMLSRGMIKSPGVWGPEKVVDQDYFFKELSKREMSIQVMTREIVL